MKPLPEAVRVAVADVDVPLVLMGLALLLVRTLINQDDRFQMLWTVNPAKPQGLGSI